MSDKQKNWYQRQHPFAPYTRAEGEAVAAELDAIQASFERIPEMRDDGKGFKVSPVVPTPTEPDHAVPLKLLSETEQSVYRSREVATTKAQEATAAAQTAVGKANEASTSAATATRQADVATSKATAAATSESNASTSANLARRWASEAENTQVANGKYSAMHYALKADASKTAAETARQQAVQKAQEVATHAQQVATNAQTSTTKAQEATAAAQTAVGRLAEINELSGEIDTKAEEAKNAATFVSIAIGQATEAKNASQANKEAAEASARQAVDSAQQAGGSAQAAATSAAQTATLKTQTESLKNQAETAKNAAEQSATVAQDAANRASAIAGGSIDYSKILNVPSASTTTKGIVQLTDDIENDSEAIAVSAKGVRASLEILSTFFLEGLNAKVATSSISNDVNSESETSVASSKAAKTAYDKGAEALKRANQVFTELDGKKENALVEHVLDLRDLDQGRWYPVLMQPPHAHKTYKYKLVHTLGTDKPSWSQHLVGFGVRCEWEVMPSAWGVWNYTGLRLVTHFEYIHCNQSPLLNLGQIATESKEYVFLRGGARYFLYAEPGVKVEISRSDYHGQDPTGQYRWHIPMLHAYDASLVPKPIQQYLAEIGTKADRATTLAGYGITNGMPVGWLGSENLNDVTTVGVYGQDSDSNATAERNYPKMEAGTLLVTPSASGVQQEYTCYYSNHKYVRGRIGSQWLSWKNITTQYHHKQVLWSGASQNEITINLPTESEGVHGLLLIKYRTNWHNHGNRVDVIPLDFAGTVGTLNSGGENADRPYHQLIKVEEINQTQRRFTPLNFWAGKPTLLEIKLVNL